MKSTMMIVAAALHLGCGGSADDEQPAPTSRGASQQAQEGTWSCVDDAAQARDGQLHMTSYMTAEEAAAWRAGPCWDAAPIDPEDVPLHP